MTRSMTRNENQDPSSMKLFNTCDNDAPASWSDLNQDLLYSVMLQLGFFYFPAFSGVCKSWRSFALSNKSKLMSKLMESKPPMYISISSESNEEDYDFYLEDIEGRSLNSILPHSGGRICVGFTCGHLIFFGSKTHDFWLLDPLTRHGVHFPDIPSKVNDDPAKFRAFLVLSPSKYGWVFVLKDGSSNIWFSVAGQGTWNQLSSTFPIVDIIAFKGKMYAIDYASHFCELTLHPEPKLTSLETKNLPTICGSYDCQQFVCSPDSLLMRGCRFEGPYEPYKLDFQEMKWVSSKPISNAETSSYRMFKNSAVVKHGKAKLYFL